MFIIQLLYFILGFLFATLFSPILDSIVGFFTVKFEKIKTIDAVKITEMNTQIVKLQKSVEDEEPVRVIGFQSTSTEEEDDEDDE